MPRGLFQAVAEEAEKHVETLSAREVANVAWAFATLHVAMPQWLVDEIPQRAAGFRPQECSNSLWALAVVSQPVHQLVSELSKSPMDPIFFAKWTPQAMANTAWALGRCVRAPEGPGADVEAPELALGAVREAIVDRIDELNSVELAMLAKTLYEEGSGALVAKVARRAAALQRQGRLSADACCQVADLVAAHGESAPSELKEPLAELQARVRQLLGRPDAEQCPKQLEGLGMSTLGVSGTRELLRSLRLHGPHAQAADSDASDGSVACTVKYHLLVTAEAGEAGEQVHRSLLEEGRVFESGEEPDPEGAGALQSAVLRFSRDKDAELLALTGVVAEARRAVLALDGRLQDEWHMRGQVWLHISQTPCLSCVSAMVQFRNMFPAVRLAVSFDAAALGRAGRVPR